MDLVHARKLVAEAIQNQEMLMVIGDCYVEYWGRAASKLPRGKRLCLIKGDGAHRLRTILATSALECTPSKKTQRAPTTRRR